MIDILGWFSNEDKFRQLVWPCDEEFAPPLKGDIDNNMLDAMYRIMCVRPDLFNSKKQSPEPLAVDKCSDTP